MLTPVRTEVRWAAAAALALGLGVLLAEPYARLAAPFYENVAALLASPRPWQVLDVVVEPGTTKLSAELQMAGYVRRRPGDVAPAARVIGRVQVGEAVETPIVFWTILLVWSAHSWKQRWLRFVVGFPVYLVLEAATTTTQLMLPLAQASAILAGHEDPVTFWDRWCRFLESGGQFALVAAAAVATVAGTRHE